MWDDEIVDEIHRIRDEHAAKFNYDLDAIIRDLQDKEMKSGRKIVSFVDGKCIVIQEASTPEELEAA